VDRDLTPDGLDSDVASRSRWIGVAEHQVVATGDELALAAAYDAVLSVQPLPAGEVGVPLCP
jgi:hypothetical protein